MVDFRSFSQVQVSLSEKSEYVDISQLITFVYLFINVYKQASLR